MVGCSPQPRFGGVIEGLATPNTQHPTLQSGVQPLCDKNGIMWKTRITKAAFEFKLQDFWIGVYWKQETNFVNHAWICVLPCFPLHIQWEKVWIGSIDDIPF